MADSNRALRALAAKPSLPQLKKQARELLKQVRASTPEAIARAFTSHPRLVGKASLDAERFSLSDAQLVVAREYGFLSWPKLKTHVDRVSSEVNAREARENASERVGSLPLIPVRDAVLFPQTLLVLHVGRSASLAALREVASGEQRVFCVAQRDPKQDAPAFADLYPIGTLARIEIVRPGDNVAARALAHGLHRARLIGCTDAGDHMDAQFELLAEPALADTELLACVLRIHAALERLGRATGRLPLPELARMAHEQSLAELIGFAAGCCELLPLEVRQRWLEQSDRVALVDELCAELEKLAAQAPAPRPFATTSAAEAQLVVLFSGGYPHLHGRRFPLTTDRTTLGRDADTDVVLPSHAVSRRHARIERREDGCFVLIDDGSTNGTYVAERSEPVASHPLTDGDQFMLGDCILCFQKAPELEAKYQAALDRMAEQDALTHLLNRRAFRARLDRAVLHARGHGEPLSLLMAGVDDLHRHNQELGSLGGNSILLRVAETLREQLSKHAILARYAGDQFAAALPRTAPDSATELAERVRVALAARELSISDVPVNVTISVGSATLADTTDTEELIDDALAALFLAKQSGRNSVRGPTP